MSGRGCYAEKMAKLRKYQIAENKERIAIEVIDNFYDTSLSRKTKQEICQRNEDVIILATLRKLGYTPKDLGLSLALA